MQLTDKGIQNYILAVRKSLTERFGGVDPTWEVQLSILEDNMHIYKKLHEAIHNNPNELSTKDLKVYKEITNGILKISQKLGISPYDKPRIKIPTKEEKEEDYVDSLMK